MTEGRRFDMSDYVPVQERVEAFYARYPDGSLQAELHLLSDNLVVMRAFAYRTPDDPRPGVGWSSMDIPGSTPYTRGSEIENCETSAWGRALAALGFEVKRNLASREEVQNKERVAEQQSGRPVPPPATAPICPKHRRTMKPWDVMGTPMWKCAARDADGPNGYCAQAIPQKLIERLNSDGGDVVAQRRFWANAAELYGLKGKDLAAHVHEVLGVQSIREEWIGEGKTWEAALAFIKMQAQPADQPLTQ